MSSDLENILSTSAGQAPEMLSKPTFEVDLIKPGGKTLSFTCSYVQEEEHPEGQEAEDEGEETKATF